MFKQNSNLFWWLLFALNLILRLPTFYTPILDVDETQFAGFAHVLMDGGLPFRDSLDTKPLGIYLFYQLIFTVFGRFNMPMVHFITALLQWGTAWGLYGIFKNNNQADRGRLAALFYIVFSTTFLPKYLSTSINAVMVFFLVFSVFFMTKKPKAIFIFLSGLILGIGFLFKYTAGIQLLLFFLFTLPFWSLTKTSWFHWFWKNALFGLSFIIPFILHGLFLVYLGVWPDFVEWSLMGSSKYISDGGSTIAFWKSFFLRFGSYILATLFLWFFAVKAFFKTDRPKSLLLMGLWFGLSLIPVCIGGRFYPHYFIHLLPSLCGLAALGFYRASASFREYFLEHKGWFYLSLTSILFFGLLRINYPLYLKYFPDDHIYQQQQVGEKLKSMASPNDKIFVWGFATGIYFHSELKASSRFLWSDLLTGRTPGPAYARINLDKQQHFEHPVAWQNFWLDMENAKPKYFVDTSPANIHGYQRFPIKNYPKLQNYLTKYYDKVDQNSGVDIYQRKER